MTTPGTPPPLPINPDFEPAHGSVSGPSGPAPAKAAAWEDLLDIFYAPSQVFERRKLGQYSMLMLLICLLSLGTFFLSQQLNEVIFDLEFARMAKESKSTVEQAAAAKAGAAKVQALSIYLIPFFIAIGSWISGFVIWMFASMMGGKLNFAQGTTIALLASMPEALERILIGAQAMFLDTASIAHKYSFHLGAARFLPADASKWALKFAYLADPFVIWGAVLLGIGVHVMGKMEKEKAAVLAIVITFIITLLIR
jgi:Yip1 domain